MWRLTLLLSLCAVGFAQTTSTEILGTITDSTSAVVSGARVTLLRTDTGERRTVTTANTGNYSFPLIEIGNYTVTAEMQGFQTQEKTGIRLQLQQKVRLDFLLAVGNTKETIEVQAATVQLKTEDAAVGQVIDNKRIVELPLNGRNIATLAVLTPGVQFGLRQGLDGSAGSPIPGRSVALTPNGQRENNQQISLDGVTAANSRVNVMVFTPSIDAIEEFKVQTSSYSAEYGQNNGAVVQIALKSGTNQLRGTLFEFLRNDKLAAENYFLNLGLLPGQTRREKNRLRRNQFGVFAGGPVYAPKIYDGRNKTFWSFNYEGLRQTIENVREANWFPEAFRGGDFSALLTPLVRDGRAIRAPIIIHDPVTGEPFRDSTGRITNIIPPSRIYKPAQDYINRYLPLPQFQPADILDINVRASSSPPSPCRLAAQTTSSSSPTAPPPSPSPSASCAARLATTTRTATAPPKNRSSRSLPRTSSRSNHCSEKPANSPAPRPPSPGPTTAPTSAPSAGPRSPAVASTAGSHSKTDSPTA